jgi:hypothetical protein
MGEITNTYKLVVRKSEWMKPLGKLNAGGIVVYINVNIKTCKRIYMAQNSDQ